MTETPAASPHEAAASERDLLLATKLHAPRSRPGLVPRDRLTDRLDDGLGYGLVLVIAPAGYGKTVLLAEWARDGRYPAAWLSLDDGDNDPARFWRHAVAALEQIRPGISERTAPFLGPPAPANYEALVTALINELADGSGSEEALLVLDDYHVIGSDEVHTSLRFLLEHRPPELRLVLASRSDPPFGLARLRARGELVELRVAELRFTVEEAGALLQQVAAGPGPALPDGVVEALAARTEGWAAGLQLAALSLRDQPDVASFVAAFTGSHRYVLDYLAEEVLERQSEEVRSFLLETSVLERLNGPLCDAVTGGRESQALLEHIDRAGLFLVPLDEVRGWWRYHHLFADLLRARLEQQPERAAALHRRAAVWYERRHLPDDAIHHTLAAGETAWAARLIEEHFDAVFNLRGEEATIQRWLPALPDVVVESRPRLLLAQAQMAAMRGDVKTMEPLIDTAERAYLDGTDEPFEPTSGKSASLLVNIPAVIALQRSYVAQLRGDAEATSVHTTKALAQVGDGEDMLSSAIQGFVAMAEWLRGHLDAAEHGFASSIAGWRMAGQVTTTAWGNYSLSRIQRARGRLDAAVQTNQRALEFTAAPGRRPLPAAGPALVELAEVAYERDDLGSALDYVTEGIALSRQFVHTPPLAAGLVTVAWIRQATGDPAGALEAVGEAERSSPGPGGLFNLVPAERARLLLVQGDLDEAARWAELCGLDADDVADYPREREHLVLARLLVANGRPDQALALLDRLSAAAESQQRTCSIIEVMAVRALALAATGDAAGAMTALARALVLAYPQGYVRVFADGGPPTAALLGQLVAAQRDNEAAMAVPLGYVARLERAFSNGQTGVDPGPSPSVRTGGLFDELTNREMEVLRMLAAGRSNQEIAAELVVSLDTVKKHVSHVLAKLGATNRTAAVARARQIALIP